MTDLEITRKCADAMGIHIAEGTGEQWAHKIWPDPHDNGGIYKYDPLHDDAQAMALVKKFCLDILHWANDAGDPPRWEVRADAYDVSITDCNLNHCICECIAYLPSEPDAKGAR